MRILASIFATALLLDASSWAASTKTPSSESNAPAVPVAPYWEKYIDSETGCGAFVNSQSHGRMAWTGACKDGLASGNGKLTLMWPDGQLALTVIGTFRNGQLVQGTVTYPDGTIETGAFRNGFLSGRGTWRSPRGAHYEGGFVGGSFSGSGKLTLPNGAHFEGQFERGVFSGQGTLTWPNGDRYVGSFKSGAPHGKCTYSYADGSTLEATFDSGHIEGEAHLKRQDGSIVSGAVAGWQQDPAHPVTFTYPPIAVRLNETGRVSVGLHIDADGNVDTAFVLSGSGHERLDNAALAVLEHAKFIPTRIGDTPIALNIVFVAVFQLH